MAGRFRNLEFDESKRKPEAHVSTQQETTGDERSLLPAAHEEYRWGRFEPALRLYTRCLQGDRAVVPAWVGQVQMLVQLGECHEARVWSDKALELFRNNGELLAAKAQACARLRDQRAAMACSDACLQVPGSSPWRWIVRGEVLLAGAQPHHESCFQKALIDPAVEWFDRIVIARVYAHYERWTNALVYLKQALELEPGHGYTWFEMGKCQEELGMVAAARTDYERCLSLRGDYREASDALQALESISVAGWLRGLWRRWSRR